MRVALSRVPQPSCWMTLLFANKWAAHFVFATTCAIAAYICVWSYQIGGAAFVSCAIVGLLFVVIALADTRYAFLFAFGFSLFQPLLTRLLFYVDFPEAEPQTMLHYNDPLTTTTSLLLICCACWALLPMLTGRRSFVPRGIQHLACFYVIIALVQVFNPYKTLLVGIYGFKNSVLPVLMIFVGCLAARSRTDLTRLVTFIAWFSAVALVYGLYQEIVGLPAFESFWYSRTLTPRSSMFFQLGSTTEIRIPSVFQGYTTYSYVITGFGILIYALGSSFSTGVWKHLRLGCLGLLALYFLFSMERIAIGMFIVGVLCFHFVTSRNRKRLFRFVVLAGAVFLILVGVLYRTGSYLKAKGWATESTRLIRIAEMSNPFGAQTVVAGRIESKWAASLDTVKRYPLTGMGVGSATFTRGQKQGAMLALPHNEFLQKQIELGLFGSVAFIIMLYTLYRRLSERTSDHDAPDDLRKYSAAMVGILAAYVVCAIFNVPFTYESGIVFWFLAGLVFYADAAGGATS